MKIRAFIFIIIASVLWGTSGIFVNNLSPYGFTSLQMTAVRATVSFLFLLIFVLIKDRKLFRTKPIDLLIFALGGLGLFGTSSCYYASMQLTSISTAVVLMYTAPHICYRLFGNLYEGKTNVVKSNFHCLYARWMLFRVRAYRWI